MGAHIYLFRYDAVGRPVEVEATPWLRVPASLEDTVVHGRDAALREILALRERRWPCGAVDGLPAAPQEAAIRQNYQDCCSSPCIAHYQFTSGISALILNEIELLVRELPDFAYLKIA